MVLIMTPSLNPELTQSLQFGKYYCSPCGKAFKPSETKSKMVGDDKYISCPLCTHCLDVEYCDDLE